MCASNPTPATVSWIAARHAPGTLRSRLICLPHAGGGAGTFRSWRPHLPDGVELAPVELPGRGSRIDEPLPQSFDTLVDALFEGLRGEFTLPYAFFGHSFGALLGYELTRRIEREIERGAGLRPPSVLLVSGSRAPHVPLDGEPVADGDEARLVAWLRSSGGLPDELLDFPDFLRDLLRAVRSDMAFAEGYRIPRPAAVAARWSPSPAPRTRCLRWRTWRPGTCTPRLSTGCTCCPAATTFRRAIRGPPWQRWPRNWRRCRRGSERGPGRPTALTVTGPWAGQRAVGSGGNRVPQVA